MTVQVAVGFGMPWSGRSSRRAVCLCPEGGTSLRKDANGLAQSATPCCARKDGERRACQNVKNKSGGDKIR